MRDRGWAHDVPPYPHSPQALNIFHEALSVARVRGTGWACKQGLQAMAYRGARCFQEGYDQPTEDVG